MKISTRAKLFSKAFLGMQPNKLFLFKIFQLKTFSARKRFTLKQTIVIFIKDFKYIFPTLIKIMNSQFDINVHIYFSRLYFTAPVLAERKSTLIILIIVKQTLIIN